MASAAHTPYLSVEDYLAHTYRPDVDYVDGHLEERNLGEYDHSTLQGTLFALLHTNRHAWHIRVAVELRVQTSPRRFRVPDVAVLNADGPKEQIVRRPPLLCLEVLSPEDTLRRMLDRIQDYFIMGVPEVWIFDPQQRLVTVCAPGGSTTERAFGLLELAGTPIVLDIAEVFSALDED
jgi:Uma2 family endonuclease